MSDKLNAALEARDQSGGQQTTHRFKRYRALQIGQTYSVRHTVTCLTCDGKEMTDASSVEAVLTTFNARRIEDSRFAETLDANLQTVIKEMSQSPETIKYVDDLTPQIFNVEFSLFMTKRALEVLPLMPDRFTQDKHEYAVKRTTVVYQASAWPIPDGNSHPTCRLDQTNTQYKLQYHWPQDLVDEMVSRLVQAMALKVAIEENGNAIVASSTKSGTNVFSLRKRTLVEGLTNENQIYDWCKIGS